MDEHTYLRLADATRRMEDPNKGNRYNETIVNACLEIVSFAIFKESDLQIANRIGEAIRNDLELIWDARRKALEDDIASETAALRLVQALDKLADRLSSTPTSGLRGA